jgi:hypothetical protein
MSQTSARCDAFLFQVDSMSVTDIIVVDGTPAKEVDRSTVTRRRNGLIRRLGQVLTAPQVN